MCSCHCRTVSHPLCGDLIVPGWTWCQGGAAEPGFFGVGPGATGRPAHFASAFSCKAGSYFSFGAAPCSLGARLMCIGSFTLCQSPPHPKPWCLNAATNAPGMFVMSFAEEL